MRTQDLIDILEVLKQEVEEIDFECIKLLPFNVLLVPYKEDFKDCKTIELSQLINSVTDK